MTRAERIARTLEAAFAPAEIEVEDESILHLGHAGARPEGETHYRVRLVSDAFRGKGRVDRHRMVTDALKPEFASGLHAFALSAKAPGEP
jgi:BolA protein